MNREEQIKFIEDNYPAYTNHISTRRIRHDFFSKIETEVQAYLLGFYAADGSIDEKRKTFRIELQIKDKEQVYLYKDIISTDARLYQNKEREFMGPKGKLIHTNGSIGVDITSAKLCNDLVNLHFGYRKSYEELHLPSIDKSLIRHFIRGYFDGDGCICGGICREKGKKDRFRKQFQIDAKKASMLLEIQKFFSENNIKVNLNYMKRDDMYRIGTSGKKAISDIYHLLYDDSYFYLSRKFNKFNHYVNTEDLQLITEACNALKVNDNESNKPSTSSEHPTKEDENIC